MSFIAVPTALLASGDNHSVQGPMETRPYRAIRENIISLPLLVFVLLLSDGRRIRRARYCNYFDQVPIFRWIVLLLLLLSSSFVLAIQSLGEEAFDVMAAHVRTGQVQ